MQAAKEALKNPKDLVKAITDLQSEKSQLEKESERCLQNKELQAIKAVLLGKIQAKNGY